jgi:hypothetical protein
MQQVKLSQTYGWRGRVYGPGHATIPEDLARAIGVTADEAVAMPQEAPGPSPAPPKPETPASDIEELKQLRSQELKETYRADGWRPIKELSQSYGLGDSAPEGGWDEAIPLIVEHEADNGLL